MDLSGLFNKNAGTTSIVSIDVAKSLAYCFEENSLKVLSLQKVNKDATRIVSIKLKDIQNTRVQSMLNGEELQNDIVVQTRKNLGLNDETEYIVKSRIVGENSYESYALNYEVLSQGLQDVVSELKYIDKIINRFKNPYLKDDVVRVGREPLRKLSATDRLAKPTLTAAGYGLPVDHLLVGIAAALHYKNDQDPQSVELQQKVEELGIRGVLKEVSGIEDESLLQTIEANYSKLA